MRGTRSEAPPQRRTARTYRGVASGTAAIRRMRTPKMEEELMEKFDAASGLSPADTLGRSPIADA